MDIEGTEGVAVVGRETDRRDGHWALEACHDNSKAICFAQGMQDGEARRGDDLLLALKACDIDSKGLERKPTDKRTRTKIDIWFLWMIVLASAVPQVSRRNSCSKNKCSEEHS